MSILNLNASSEQKRYHCRSRTTKLSDEIEDIINEVGGTIYGGYVRDLVIIQKNAKNFFLHAKELDMFNAVDMYRKSTYMPEFSNRLLEQSTIDCILSVKQLESFSLLLTSAKLLMSEYNSKACKDVFDVPVTHKSYFIKYDVHDLVQNIAPWNVTISIAIYDDSIVKVAPLPMQCYLECNSLVLVHNQIILNKNTCEGHSILEKIEKLHRIIDDIEKGQTNISIFEQCNSKSVQNICMLRDFTIKSSNFKLKYQKLEGEVCYICNESTQYTLRVSKNCCLGNHVHIKCCRNWHDLNFCPSCK